MDLLRDYVQKSTGISTALMSYIPLLRVSYSPPLVPPIRELVLRVPDRLSESQSHNYLRFCSHIFCLQCLSDWPSLLPASSILVFRFLHIRALCFARLYVLSRAG